MATHPAEARSTTTIQFWVRFSTLWTPITRWKKLFWLNQWQYKGNQLWNGLLSYFFLCEWMLHQVWAGWFRWRPFKNFNWLCQFSFFWPPRFCRTVFASTPTGPKQNKNNANGHDAFFVLWWGNLWRFVAINFVKICFVSGTFGKNVTSLIFCYRGCRSKIDFRYFFTIQNCWFWNAVLPVRLLPWGRIIVALLASWGHRPFQGQKIEAIR